MTSTTKASATEVNNRLAIQAALERAAKVVGKGLPKGSRLAEGAVRLDLAIKLAGDITVGKDTPPGDPVEISLVDLRQLLAVILRELGTERAEKLIGAGIKDLKRAAGDDAGAVAARKRIEADQAAADEAVFRISKRRSYTASRTASGRRGAISGAPGVAVSGSVAGSKIEIEVDGAA